MAENEELQFDENDAIKFIRNYMPADIRDRYDDDEILNIIDMIWDFYEDNGLLDIPSFDQMPDPGDEPAQQLQLVMDYVNKMLAKDKLAAVDKADVHYIVEGELAYEQSIGLE